MLPLGKLDDLKFLQTGEKIINRISLKWNTRNKKGEPFSKEGMLTSG